MDPYPQLAGAAPGSAGHGVAAQSLGVASVAAPAGLPDTSRGSSGGGSPLAAIAALLAALIFGRAALKRKRAA
jgi:hypothetical protein